MAEKKIYIGSIGPLLYDDSDPIDDADGDFTGVDQQGFATDGSTYVGGNQEIVGDLVVGGDLDVTGDITIEGTIEADTVGIADTDDSHHLILTWNENDSADRVLNFLVGGAARSVTLSGNLTVESSSLVNQDLTTDAGPTFASLSLGTGELTCGSINRASGTLTLEIGGVAQVSITNTAATFAHNIILPDGGDIRVADGSPDIFLSNTNSYIGLMGGNVGINDATPEARLKIRETTDQIALSVNSAATTVATMLVLGKYGMSFQQNADGGYAAQFYRDRSEAGSYALMQVKDDNASNTQPALEVIQDGTAADGVKVTSAYMGLRIQSKYGFISQQTVSGGYAGQFWRDQAEAGSNPLVEIIDDHTSNTQPTLKIRQDGSGSSLQSGDGTNYAAFASDGELTLVGTARVTKWVWIIADAIKAPGAKPATDTAFGALELPVWSFSDEGVEGNQQTVSLHILPPSDLDITVAPTLLIGWTTAGASAGNAEWQLEYLWVSEDESAAAAAEETLAVTDAASATANGLNIATITGINTPSATDKCMLCRLTRLSAGGNDTIAAAIVLHGVCLHYTSNRLGEAT